MERSIQGAIVVAIIVILGAKCGDSSSTIPYCNSSTYNIYDYKTFNLPANNCTFLIDYEQKMEVTYMVHKCRTASTFVNSFFAAHIDSLRLHKGGRLVIKDRHKDPNSNQTLFDSSQNCHMTNQTDGVDIFFKCDVQHIAFYGIGVASALSVSLFYSQEPNNSTSDNYITFFRATRPYRGPTIYASEGKAIVIDYCPEKYTTCHLRLPELCLPTTLIYSEVIPELLYCSSPWIIWLLNIGFLLLFALAVCLMDTAEKIRTASWYSFGNGLMLGVLSPFSDKSHYYFSFTLLSLIFDVRVGLFDVSWTRRKKYIYFVLRVSYYVTAGYFLPNSTSNSWRIILPIFVSFLQVISVSVTLNGQSWTRFQRLTYIALSLTVLVLMILSGLQVSLTYAFPCLVVIALFAQVLILFSKNSEKLQQIKEVTIDFLLLLPSFLCTFILGYLLTRHDIVNSVLALLYIQMIIWSAILIGFIIVIVIVCNAINR